MEKITPSDISKELVGKELIVYGVVLHIRDLGAKKFIILTDGGNNLQVVYEGEEKVRRGDSLKIRGILCEDQRSPNGIELRANDLEILSKTLEDIFDQWTLRKMSKDKKIKYRQLVLRLPEYFKIFETYAKVAQLFREFFIKKGYLEVFTPKIVIMGTESGSEVFSILYFDKEAYLAQSPQLYKQMILASGVKGVFEIASYYRSEVSFTPRHITEFRSVDAEINYIEDYNEVMDVLEEAVKYVCKSFGLKVNEIPRITFEEAQRVIKEKDPKVYRWDDISTEGERILGEYAKEKYDSEFIFVTEYPSYSRAFYYMRFDEDPKRTKSFDLIFRGLEVTSGGQREHRYDKVIAQLKEKGINPERLKYYLEAFKYGIPPHGGFGLGLDRFVKQLLNLDDVRECVLWPRDPDTLIP